MFIMLILNFFNVNATLVYPFFLNYSTYCYLTIFLNFLIEFFLFFYIIYHFLFFDLCSRTCFKYSFFRYTLFLCFLIILLYFFLSNNSSTMISYHLFNNKYIFFCKFIVILLLFLSLLMGQSKFRIKCNNNLGFSELSTILSFLILFICLLISSSDFFVMYLIIEGISLVIYSLGSLMNKSLLNLEAIIKYFLLNNMASSFLLWSISYIYIFTGTTDSFDLQYLLISTLETIILEHFYYICFFFLLSVLFKLALFPFHWWVADIYEGLWTPITLIYAVLIKMTFFLFFLKLILSFFYSLLFLFQPFLIISALGSLILGSLGALIQVKIKRFLAYTSIVQSGYILLGVACLSLNGFIGSFLYLIMYCFITLSFFCILLNLEQVSKSTNIIYFNQLYSFILYNKEVTWHLIIILFVMAALPPFSSFFAKLFIFIITIEAKLAVITLFFLAFSLITTFYYLTFIQQLIFFKFNNSKIILFQENCFTMLFLRICCFLFCFSFFFLSWVHDFTLFLLISCLWPLTN